MGGWKCLDKRPGSLTIENRAFKIFRPFENGSGRVVGSQLLTF